MAHNDNDEESLVQMRRKSSIMLEAPAVKVATPIQRAKYERIFKAKDLDGDGKVSVDDWINWGKQAAAHLGVGFTATMEESYRIAYAAFFEPASTMDEWIERNMKFCAFPGSFELAVETNSMHMFDAIDLNKDGMISLDEYAGFIKPLGVTDPDAVAYGFQMIDTDGNGDLSRDEFGTAMAKYYFDEEESPYQHFYGKWEFFDTK